jgi:tetratricopeptide (TPR) repeat protein
MANQSFQDSATYCYQQKDYQNAIRIWENMRQNGTETAELFYNLGNAHFKMQHIGLSILYFEKALRLSPEDDDIQHNIEIARKQISKPTEAIPDLFFIVWLNKMNLWFSSTVWAIISIVLFLGFLGMLLWRLFRKKYGGSQLISYSSGLIFLLSGICFLLAIRSESIKNDSNFAIILKDVMVKSSPSETGVNLFEVDEGNKVEIQDSLNLFTEIRLSDGKVGWVESEKIEKI